MEMFLDVSKVTTGVFSPGTCTYFQNTGLWHNYFMYSTLKRLQDFGTKDPSLETWLNYFDKIGDDLEAKKLLPIGSAKIIDELISIFKSAETTTEFSTTIVKFQQLHQRVIENPEFKETSILAITSVAYYSSLFLSEVNEIKGDKVLPLKIPKWLTGVAADIGGAFGGIGTGILLGPGGAVVGGIIGAAAGTIAAL